MRPRVLVISPESEDSREAAALGALFAAGLERYHVRKPGWSREQLANWLRALPAEWRSRLVLHQHHVLVDEFGVGGVHFRDDGGAGSPRRPRIVRRTGRDGARNGTQARSESGPHLFVSRSCHEAASVRAALGRYDSIFFSPVFPSISKPGYGPTTEIADGTVATLLANRTADQRRTSVLALGGITADTTPLALALGFDGVAALGAIWQAADPVAAFTRIQEALRCHA